MVRSDFYVYVIFRPNGQPCYIGKGKGRRWRAHFRKCLNPHLAAIIKQAGGDLPVVVIRDNLTEPEAFEIERAFIAAIGRKANDGPLVNMTDGGDGPHGHVQSPEARQKKREAMLRPEVLEAARQRAAGNTYRRGSTASKETREKLRVSHTGHKQSDETKEKRALKLRGRKRSPEFCARASANRKGEKRSPEAKARMSAACIGRIRSPEAKAKTSESLRAWWAARKATKEITSW